MSTQSRVTAIDYEKLTAAEKQFVDLYGLEDLDRALKTRPPAAAPVQRPAQAEPSAFSIIGKEQRDIEGYKIVTGQARYTVDVYLPNMLYVKVLRSPLPHARVKSIDTSKAAQLPGVQAVFTYQDIPEKMTAGGRPILASEVALVGDGVAVVAAASETVAEDALRLIEVEYEALPFVLDPREAEKPSSPLARSDLQSNLAGNPYKVERGDAAAGFAEADVTVEHTTDTQDQEHVAMEPHAAVAQWEGDRLTMWVSSQYTHATANLLAASFGLPKSHVRVIADFTGGGWGDKAGVAYPYILLVSLLAKKTGRPVRYELSRTDVFLETSHHYPVIQSVKLGFKQDGSLTALQSRSLVNAGAYSPFAAFLAADTLSAARLQYNCPNVALEGVGVITNSAVAGARRCVGEPSGVFALETLMDEAAEKLGMDPVELRLMNINEEGDPESGLPWSSNGLREAIVKGAEAFRWKDRWKGWDAVGTSEGPIKRGVGFMAMACNKGSKGPPMTAVVQIPPDGSVLVVQGGAHIGGPQRTTFAMIAAEALGAALDQVYVTTPDTEFTSDTGVVAGSRATKSIGLAVQTAAEDARRQLLDFAAAKFTKDLGKQIKAEQLDVKDGLISIKDDATTKPITFREAVASGFVIVDAQPIPAAATVIGRGVVPPETRYAQQTYAAAFYEVEVNTQTGVVQVVDALQVHDVGRVINLLGLRNQVEGGAVQGIGFALTEEFKYDPATGIPVTANLDDYKMQMINHTPPITAMFIESDDAVGPFGAKGVGEPALALASPAISNAIYHAVGIRMKSLPMIPKKVLDALKSTGV
ncbi:MAG TPA: xanthine dehydrogenase family protein molybdopterin-binding subunit [Anaerolineales bacterium]|nr:xanthine dehydrogenase family protein molybdopterin-binding subunit [Anaerolineales bacterium]